MKKSHFNLYEGLKNVNFYEKSCFHGKKCMVGKENFICINEHAKCPINDLYIGDVKMKGYISRRMPDGRFLLYNSEKQLQPPIIDFAW